MPISQLAISTTARLRSLFHQANIALGIHVARQKSPEALIVGRDPVRHSIFFGKQKVEAHVQMTLDLGLANCSFSSVDMTKGLEQSTDEVDLGGIVVPQRLESSCSSAGPSERLDRPAESQSGRLFRLGCQRTRGVGIQSCDSTLLRPQRPKWSIRSRTVTKSIPSRLAICSKVSPSSLYQWSSSSRVTGVRMLDA